MNTDSDKEIINIIQSMEESPLQKKDYNSDSEVYFSEDDDYDPEKGVAQAENFSHDYEINLHEETSKGIAKDEKTFSNLSYTNFNDEKKIESVNRQEQPSKKRKFNLNDVRYVGCGDLATHLQKLPPELNLEQAMKTVSSFFTKRRMDHVQPEKDGEKDPFTVMAEFVRETSKCSIKVEIVKTVSLEQCELLEKKKAKYQTLESVIKKDKNTKYLIVIQMYVLNGNAFLAHEIFNELLFECKWSSTEEDEEEFSFLDSDDDSEFSDSGSLFELRYLVMTTTLMNFWWGILQTSIIPDIENVLILLNWNITQDEKRKLKCIENNLEVVCKFDAINKVIAHLIDLIGDRKSTLVQVRVSLEILDKLLPQIKIQLKKDHEKKLKTCLRTWSGKPRVHYWIPKSTFITDMCSSILERFFT